MNVMPQQDNIGGQKADNDTHTDCKILWQQPVTSIQEEQVGTSGHQFQRADRNDQSRQDVPTDFLIGKRQDQGYPPSTPCDPLTHHKQTRPLQGEEHTGGQQADYGPSDVPVRGKIANDWIDVVRPHIGAGCKSGCRIRKEGQGQDPYGNHKRL
ncbi:MAG: hypothetical protein ACE5JQ_12160 [Candidatus Methylomirabilales bacterium]